MKQTTKFIFAIIVTTISCGITLAQNNNKIIGTYRAVGMETKNEAAKIKVYKQGSTYEAQIIWLEHPLDANGNPRLDILNPNPKLQSVPGDKIVIIKGLKYDAKKDRWIGGKIYNPTNGKTFDVMAEFESPSKLKVRAFLGKPAFGKSFIWNRVQSTDNTSKDKTAFK